MKFGTADFNLELKGFNYKSHYPESYIKGNIASFEYSQYKYENIALDGVYKDGGFNGKLAMDDDKRLCSDKRQFQRGVRHTRIQLEGRLKESPTG